MRQVKWGIVGTGNIATQFAQGLQQVEHAIAHDPRAEVVRRATAIRLLHQGHTPQAVGEMLAASRASAHSDG